MKTLSALLGLVAVLTAGDAGQEAEPPFELPFKLRNYRWWTPLVPEPREVALSSWSLCRSPTAADLADRFGPHAKPLVMVFGSPDVAQGLLAADRRRFTIGAILAKEKLLARDGPPVGVAFMVKRMTPVFQDSGGWEFLYYPASPDPAEARRTHEHCAACHRSAAARDYVFGAYDEARLGS